MVLAVAVDCRLDAHALVVELEFAAVIILPAIFFHCRPSRGIMPDFDRGVVPAHVGDHVGLQDSRRR